MAGKRSEAIVRRKQGAMYDFEFIVITPQIAAQLVKLCEGLPLSQNLTDVEEKFEEHQEKSRVPRHFASAPWNRLPMETAATMETTAMEADAGATVETRCGMSAAESAGNRRVIPVTRPIRISRPIAITRTAIETARPIVSVIPGTSTDKYAANKPVRPVIPVWSASVWIIAVVPVCTNRRGPNACHNRSYANTNRYLSVGASCHSQNQDPQ